jgi:hypothetical protein
MRSPVALLVVALGLAGCVVGAPRPPTRLDVARAPAERPRADVAAKPAHPGCGPAPADEPRPPGPPGSVWVEGDCHYDGIRYVWVPGRWQPRAAPYSWK